MRNNFKQFLYNPVCLSCGSFFQQNHLFCEVCFVEKISPRLDLKENPIEVGLTSYALFEWNPGESDLLSEFVYRMKSNRCVLAWNFYGNLALKALDYHVDLSQIKYIIPVPGSKPTSTHAVILAQIASEFLKKPVLNILEKVDVADGDLQQKAKGREQRSAQKFRIREQFTENFEFLNLRQASVLVVDDIATTGSSFRQSVLALSKPASVNLLSLFYRSTKSKGILVS